MRTSIFEEHRPLIKKLAAAGISAKDIADALGAGYDHHSLWTYMHKTGIKVKKACAECVYKVQFKNIDGQNDIWVCMIYRRQIRVNGWPIKICLERIKKENAVQK